MNASTGGEIFYHGSKGGLSGGISPNVNAGRNDFGDGFYLGTKERQTLARAANEAEGVIYEFKIPEACINRENTVRLAKDDWMYFVLYNRGRLEEFKGSRLYEKYAHLADGKDFIIGPIADDAFDRCLNDFLRGRITDWMLMQLIDSFGYGLQVAAKSDRACKAIEMVSERRLSKQERKGILEALPMNRKQRSECYDGIVRELNIARKGRYIDEIRREAFAAETAERELGRLGADGELSEGRVAGEEGIFRNIIFPDRIGEEEAELELF